MPRKAISLESGQAQRRSALISAIATRALCATSARDSISFRLEMLELKHR
jgi:hypothetical protein